MPVKVNDEAVQKFVINRSQDYFNRVAKELAQHIIDMDVFARSAQNESSNRDRLIDMTETFIDYVHYVNDILMIGKEELVRHEDIGLFVRECCVFRM